MSALSEDPERIKVVHQYGVGLHSQDLQADYDDPRWQQRQILDFIEFAVEAEELGYDGITVTEHHARSFACPAPHVLLAAAAAKTSRIRLGTAVTVLPLYNPVRVAEEAGTLDLLSDGRFELGVGRGIPGEVGLTLGRVLGSEAFMRRWSEGVELLHLALNETEFTFEGEFWSFPQPTTISTRPLQDPLPVWIGGASLDTMALAAGNHWNIMRNFGSPEDHRRGFEHYLAVGEEHGQAASGANFMLERFVSIAYSEVDVDRNLARLVDAMSHFVSMHSHDTGQAIPAHTDGEVMVTSHGGKKRPAIAVSGTPDQVTESLQQALAETGARRLMIETFSLDEMRLFATEVLPALHESRAGRP
jgi:alkanesulfonate monooxygenase SsuD/methylene tetrahydromethanopterin reductase-like flavin-dependent oxidoreductase (luciferase family)